MVKIFSNDCLGLVSYIQSLRKHWLYVILNILFICVKEDDTADIKLFLLEVRDETGLGFQKIQKTKKQNPINSRVTTEIIKTEWAVLE